MLTRRRLIILLHWSVLMLVLAMIKGGSAAPVLRWVFVLAGGVWVGMAMMRGIRAKPSPKLSGILRSSFRAQHFAMYALVGIAVLINLGALLDLLPLVWGWNVLLVLLVAGTFHGIFHFWRHTALMDGALRMISPKALHKYL